MDKVLMALISGIGIGIGIGALVFTKRVATVADETAEEEIVEVEENNDPETEMNEETTEVTVKETSKPTTKTQVVTNKVLDTIKDIATDDNAKVLVKDTLTEIRKIKRGY